MSSVFRSSMGLRKVVDFGRFALQSPLQGKRLGDGHEFGQPVHLQIAIGVPLDCRLA